MGSLIQRVVLILAVGCGLGLLSNAISPKGIALVTPPKKVPQPDEFISLQKAHELWNGGGAFFLDARQPADFEAGHIGNALNLPVEEFGEYFPKVAAMFAPDSELVVYCDGPECELSHRLVSQLQQLGYTRIHILFNGWTVWREAGYPSEIGASK